MMLRDFIFPIWRRIPVGLRQRISHVLLDALTSPIPQVSPEIAADRDAPRIIVGFLSSPSGMGQSARLLASALRKAGYAVFGIDLGGYFFEPVNVVDHGLPDGRAIQGKAHLIVNINAPYMPYALQLLKGDFLRNKYITGYWAWELPRLPDSWRRGFACVHDIAVPSSFVANAVREMNDGKNILVLPHPVAMEFEKATVTVPSGPQGGIERPFTVGFMANIASGFARKNPLGLIAAFRKAFGDDPRCRLKMLLTNAEHYPAARSMVEKAVGDARNIVVTWRGLGRGELRHWWRDVSLYASLHRSEGFGLPLAEAMCAGLPVVATGWSGNLEFMTHANSFLVRYELVDVRDDQGKYPEGMGMWAEPDVEHAAELLHRARSQWHLAKSVGERARRDVMVSLSANAITSRFQHHYHDIAQDKVDA